MKTIDEYLDEARARLDRVNVDDLDEELVDGALLVDIRPVDLRDRDGHIEGALTIDRNVLEWRLAPSSDHRIVDLKDGQRVILFCDEGFASSLAAEGLLALGVNATDLVGGYQAWLARND